MNQLPAYIKFTSPDTILFELIDLQLFKEHFEEFETIYDMLKDLEMEYHDGNIIANHLPLSSLSAFKILHQVVHGIEPDWVEDGIDLLYLLCKWANKEQIDYFMDQIDIDTNTWLTLADYDFDVNNYFSERRRIDIYRQIRMGIHTFDEEKYLRFYGLPWFIDIPKYHMNNNGFPQRRIRDRLTKDCYQVTVIGNKAILFDRQQFRPVPDPANIFDCDALDQITLEMLDSVSSSSSDDEFAYMDCAVTKLSKEMIDQKRYNNFVLEMIDVHFADKIAKMQLIETTMARRARVNMLYKSKSASTNYRSD